MKCCAVLLKNLINLIDFTFTYSLYTYHSIDRETEARIHDLVNIHFKENTVLAITHHLESILHFDKGLVIEGGVVVAYDSIGVLVNSHPLFSNVVSEKEGNMALE